MAKKSLATVEAYIAAQPEGARAVLAQVRQAIRKGAPKAEESISYDMPTYKLHGERLLHFAGWKKHYSLYPATPEVLEAFHDELAAYKVKKSTVQFPLAQPVPAKLIERIAKFRAGQLAGRSEKSAG